MNNACMLMGFVITPAINPAENLTSANFIILKRTAYINFNITVNGIIHANNKINKYNSYQLFTVINHVYLIITNSK